MSRDHLVLLYRTCRDFEIILRVGGNLIAYILLGIDAVRFDEQDLGYVLIASFEVRDCTEFLGKLRVDEIFAFINKVNTIGIADGVRVIGCGQ